MNVSINLNLHRWRPSGSESVPGRSPIHHCTASSSTWSLAEVRHAGPKCSRRRTWNICRRLPGRPVPYVPPEGCWCSSYKNKMDSNYFGRGKKYYDRYFISRMNGNGAIQFAAVSLLCSMGKSTQPAVWNHKREILIWFFFLLLSFIDKKVTVDECARGQGAWKRTGRITEDCVISTPRVAPQSISASSTNGDACTPNPAAETYKFDASGKSIT